VDFKSLFVLHELFQLYHIMFYMFYYPQTTYDIFYMEHISVKINKTNIIIPERSYRIECFFSHFITLHARKY
jgi:hypothetical protein